MTAPSHGPASERIPAARLLVAASSLGTGAALLVYVVAGISLLHGAVAAILLFAVVAAAAQRRGYVEEGSRLLRRLKAGSVAGVAATLAYDGSRLLLIELTGIAFWPFDVFLVFGQALVGAGATGLWVEIAGFAYHMANGVGFAIAYTLLFAERGIMAGIAWALALETLMVSVYPSWLGVRALDEFLQVSILGHLVYGAVLGHAARAALGRLESNR